MRTGLRGRGNDMGSMTYDGMVVEFDDRMLAHLQVIIVNRFQAGRPLLMSWLDALDGGDGRSAIWLTPGSPLEFKFAGSRSPVIDRAWLEVLSKRAESGAGLIVCDAQGVLVRALGHHRLTAGRPAEPVRAR